VQQCIFVDSSRLLRVGEQCLDLRGEGQPPMMHAVVKRLDAHAVADQPQFSRARVPQRDREHTAEALQTVYAPLLKSVQDDFSIRVVRLPGVAAECFQLVTDFRMVIYLAVKHDAQTAIFILHRLRRGFRQIDDR